MLKKIAFIAAAMTSAIAIPAAAEAQRGYYDSRYERPVYRSDRYDRNYDRYGRTYDRYGNRVAANSGYYDNRYDRRNDGYYGRTYRNEQHGRRCSGTTGTIVGGVAGALLGREITRGSSRYGRSGGNSGTTGAIIGGAVGALAGRAVDKSNCR